MSDFNRVYLVGNLVKDPEMKNIGSSNKVTNFTIASNRNWTGPEGQKMEEVSFIDCVAYGKRGETINTYFSKGRKILLEGRMKQEKWTDKDTQKTQSRLRVIVEQFHFMDSKKSEAAGSCVPAEAGGDDTVATPIGDNSFDID
jgi:single-strand DNA-binding protein